MLHLLSRPACMGRRSIPFSKIGQFLTLRYPCFHLPAHIPKSDRRWWSFCGNHRQFPRCEFFVFGLGGSTFRCKLSEKIIRLRPPLVWYPPYLVSTLPERHGVECLGRRRSKRRDYRSTNVMIRRSSLNCYEWICNVQRSP